MRDDLEALCHEELSHTDGPVTRKLKQQAQRIEKLEETLKLIQRDTNDDWAADQVREALGERRDECETS